MRPIKYFLILFLAILFSSCISSEDLDDKDEFNESDVNDCVDHMECTYVITDDCTAYGINNKYFEQSKVQLGLEGSSQEQFSSCSTENIWDKPSICSAYCSSSLKCIADCSIDQMAP